MDDTNMMSEGSIAKKIIYFAIPLFLGNLFQQLYNTADSLIVGNFLGNEEVELLVKIISDDHYISNTFKLFKRIIKSAKAIQ